jgi:acetate kinase
VKVLVFNAGSSSLKIGVFDMMRKDSRIFKASFENFRDGASTLHYRCGGETGIENQRQESVATLAEAITRVPDTLTEFGYQDIDAIGHRIAHGGSLADPALIDDDLLKAIESCTVLAPLHNPANLLAVETARRVWPDLPQVAVFDTAFHHSIPDYASTYAVPKEWRDKGLRRYGFHGTSHKYVALRSARETGCDIADLKIISCHLGNGASVCAISGGISVDTSMGMTPIEGLVMGTRSGDIDPGAFAFIARETGLDAAAIEQKLYHDSGLYALGGSADFRDIEAKAIAGDADAQLAVQVYAYRVRKYIGAYAAAMGGLDILAFTGGIGENAADIRRRVCNRLGFLGLYLHEDKNAAIRLQGFEAPQVQAADSRVRIIVTQTCEQLMIAEEVRHLLTAAQSKRSGTRIPVAVSARHVHLSQEDVGILFGAGYSLTKQRDLNQPDGWAAAETVEVIGPKGSFGKVRVLGPVRKKTQIEISRTDSFTLGVNAPLRHSGDLDDTPRILLRGPAGEVYTDGLIVAARHIHMSPQDAHAMHLENGDLVTVSIGDGARSLSFAHTLIRVKEGSFTEMHIDTDEANAAGIGTGAEGEVKKVTAGAAAHIRAVASREIFSQKPRTQEKVV